MGYNEEAVRKGTISELLAQVFWVSKGYDILVPINHESKFDFAVVYKPDRSIHTVQVKSAIISRFNQGSPTLWRCRNKRGQNGSYVDGDYDFLHVVRETDNTHWIIPYHVVGESENITLEREDGENLRSNSKFLDMWKYKIS